VIITCLQVTGVVSSGQEVIAMVSVNILT